MSRPLPTLLLLLAACAGPAGLAGAPRAPSSAAREALDDWLLAGHPEQARARLEALAAARPGEPWTRIGAALLAERALQPEQALPHLAALVGANPDHPLALVALRELVRMVSAYPELAADVEAALAGLRPVTPLTGLAAYRARVARLFAAQQRGDGERLVALRREAGAVTRWSVAGPFGDFAPLDFDRPFPPEQGELPASVAGALLAPPRPTRPLEAPTGDVTLEREPDDGAFHYLAADLELEEGGLHLATLRADGSVRAWLDGSPLAERRAWAGRGGELVVVAVSLAPGPHELLVKLGRDGGASGVLLGLARADGRPTRLTARPHPPGPLRPLRPGPFPPPAFAPGLLAGALDDGGPVAARYLAARDVISDLEGAKALAEEALALAPRSAPLLALRGFLHLADGSLDEQVRRSRAEEALRRALAIDPGDGPTRLELAQLLLSAERPADAEQVLAALPGPLQERWPALVARARLAAARDQAVAAELLAGRALAAGARCSALGLLLDQAVQRDEPARADRLAVDGAACPGGPLRLARQRLQRGDPAGALALLEPWLRWHAVGSAELLDLLAARRATGDAAGALAFLGTLRQAWPRDAALASILADQLELDGDRAGARAAREEALRLDGADLPLRRRLALDDGREVLDDLAVDGEAVLRQYRAAAPRETGSAVLVLDAAAVEFHPGGASTERVHQLFRLLDPQAVHRFGEVQPPEDAQLLQLRTIKADGRVVEPDPSDAKGSRSLAALEPGDYFELEYLRVNPPPRPAPPVATTPFYVAEFGERVFASSYAVRAPRGFGLQVDAHRLEAPAEVAVEGDRELLRVERRDVPMVRQEPHSPPGPERLPFLQVGVGDATEAVQRRQASAMAGLLRPTLELAAVAAQVRARAGAGATPEALARAAWAETASRLPGAAAVTLAPASTILSRGRGSRLVLMAALLEALGIEARFALVKPFDANHEPYRLGREEAWAALLLRVQLPGGPVWLEGPGRLVPFGGLQQKLRDAEALILPRPGEPPTRDRTPPAVPIAERRETELLVQLAGDGSAELSGVERFAGVIGASVKELILRADETLRRQGIESLYGGSLPGFTIAELRFEGLDEPDQPLTIRWRGRAPAAARASEAGLRLEWLGPPAQLARQFAALPSRESPLLIDELLDQVTRVELVPPPGFAVPPPASQQLDAAGGRYQRTEWGEGGALRWEERLAVPLARIAPADFPAFAAFAAAVDAAQARTLLLAPLPPR